MAEDAGTRSGRSRGGGRSTWARRYPPLLVIGVVLFLALAIMPSSLTLPQENPSTVLEYAPVPPEDENPPPPQQGNVSNLGLGSTSSVTEEIATPPPPPSPPPGEATGGNPTVYDCVEGRQTEDPLAPPCSPYFDGDNHGATYQGVTGDEIRILIYMDGSESEDSGASIYDGEEAPVGGTYCDLDVPDSPPKCHNDTGTDHLWVRVHRALARYVNARFQSYRRHLHFYLYWSRANSISERRADAADNVETIDPFAVIDQATFDGFNKAYTDAMARKGVMVFSSLQGQPRSFYQQYEPLVWSFNPDIETRVNHYVEYICKKVEPYGVSHAGAGVQNNGQDRRYGYMYTSDPAFPDLHHFRDLVIPALEDRCGVTPETEVTFPTAGYAVDTGGDPAYARLNVADLRQNDVTTLLWFGGVEGKTSQAMDEQQYIPEIIYAGDTFMEGTFNGQLQNQNAWQHAWITTNVLREDRLERTHGYQAYYEANPQGNDGDAAWANTAYRDFFMVATGIQAAGPRLHPVTVDEGFHAIPEVRSSSPYVPAFFFPPGGYTGVQDATHMWWDPQGTAPGNTQPGCYRMVQDGQRYNLGNWPEGDTVFQNPNDACNGYDGGAQLVVRTPGLEE